MTDARRWWPAGIPIPRPWNVPPETWFSAFAVAALAAWTGAAGTMVVSETGRRAGAVLLIVGLLPLLGIVWPRLVPWAVYAFFASLPLFGNHSYSINSHVFELTLATVGLALHRLPLAQNRLNRAVLWPLLAYVGLVLASLLVTPLMPLLAFAWHAGPVGTSAYLLSATPNLYLYSTVEALRLALFALVCTQLARRAWFIERREQVFMAILAGTALSVLAGLASALGWLELDWLRQQHESGQVLQSTFGNPGWFSEYLSLTIPMVLTLLHGGPGRRHWIWPVLALLILAEIAIVLTGSRTAWLIYPLVLVLAWAVYHFTRQDREAGRLRSWARVGLRVLVSIPLTLGISLAIVYVVFVYQPSDTGTTVADEWSRKEVLEGRVQELSQGIERLRIWESATAMWSEAPIFGLGYQSYHYRQLTLRDLPDSPFFRHYDKHHLYDEPHNLYLQILVSNGIAGLLAWIVLVASIAWVAGRALFKTGNRIMLPVLVSVGAFHVYGLTQGMFYIPMIGFLFFFLAACVLCEAESSTPFTQQSRRWLAFGSAGLLVAAAILYASNFQGRLFAAKYGLALFYPDPDLERFAGFHHREDWSGETFRWSSRSGAIRFESGGPVHLEIQGGVPGAKEQQLELTWNGEPLETIIFPKYERVQRDFRFDQGGTLGLRVDRTWNPRRVAGAPDARWLGVAVSVREGAPAGEAGPEIRPGKN